MQNVFVCWHSSTPDTSHHLTLKLSPFTGHVLHFLDDIQSVSCQCLLPLCLVKRVLCWSWQGRGSPSCLSHTAAGRRRGWWARSRLWPRRTRKGTAGHPKVFLSGILHSPCTSSCSSPGCHFHPPLWACPEGQEVQSSTFNQSVPCCRRVD